jgi:hypothetical protein
VVITALITIIIIFWRGTKIREDEMGGGCGTYKRENKFVPASGWITWRKETTMNT